MVLSSIVPRRGGKQPIIPIALFFFTHSHCFKSQNERCNEQVPSTCIVLEVDPKKVYLSRKSLIDKPQAPIYETCTFTCSSPLHPWREDCQK
jgi:hypothetical protein